ncbi:MAG: hypothetical protein A2Z20_08040 [Bdellovibrionales bacterium RBG_16_40_8]|nr:MAG: hypothetical protein A2Z20_08040 [Bdellovibrionales bacterium RBG_16_40_8]
MGNKKILKNLYLFKDLSDNEIKIIEKATSSCSFGVGDEVFSQGDRATALYVIHKGSIKIYQKTSGGDKVEITRIGDGSHFGEMSFLDGEARSASAAALESTEILAIDYNKLNEIMREHQSIAVHFYKQFSIFLCGRLRVTTQDLSFSRSKILSHF